MVAVAPCEACSCSSRSLTRARGVLPGLDAHDNIKTLESRSVLSHFTFPCLAHIPYCTPPVLALSTLQGPLQGPGDLDSSESFRGRRTAVVVTYWHRSEHPGGIQRQRGGARTVAGPNDQSAVRRLLAERRTSSQSPPPLAPPTPPRGLTSTNRASPGTRHKALRPIPSHSNPSDNERSKPSIIGLL